MIPFTLPKQVSSQYTSFQDNEIHPDFIKL